MLNVFVIYYRTNELTPQTFFYLYDEHTRQQIPPSQLQYTTINVKIKTTININQTNVIKQIHNYNNKNNVNIFQINNEVFNDYCAGFYDKETNKDVVLSDRRKYIYKPLCDEDYIMESIEWNDKDNSINKVICKGKMIDIMLSPVREKLVNETGEVFFEDNVKKESAANVFNCGNTAFKSSKIKHNFGFWIMLIFIIVQIVIVIIYFVNCFSNYMEYLDYLDNKIIMNEQDKELLFIDDLGVEAVNIKVYGNEFSPVTELLYNRYDRNLVTILTSNLSDEQMKDRYGARIDDRLREMFDKIHFQGPSYRK